jgi:hypothetical protein
MDQSKQHAIRFLEKEIKTYTALALFFSKKGSKEPVKVEGKGVFIRPAFYKMRMKEAKRIVSALRKAN